MRFRLRNYQGTVPRVSCTSIICETVLDSFPNTSGQISQSLWPNNLITPSTTFYTIEFWDQGQIKSSANYLINAATDLDCAAPINSPAEPPISSAIIFQNNGVNNSSQTLLNLESLDGSVVITDEGSGNINLAARGNQVGPRPAFGNWKGWTFNGSDTLVPYGCQPASSGQAKTALAMTATEPGYAVFSTGSTASSQATVQMNESATCTTIGFCYNSFNLALLGCYQTRVQLQSTTNERVWIGIGFIQGQGAPFIADNPLTGSVNNICCFRYSTNAGDTHWQAFVGTTGSNFTLVDTGVTPDTNGHIFQITFDGTHVNFWIDGVNVAAVSTNVPATNQLMQDIVSIDNVGLANNKSVNVSFQYVETTK